MFLLSVFTNLVFYGFSQATPLLGRLYLLRPRWRPALGWWLAMSRTKISFYDFAEYFRRAGCWQALYLDGFVSPTYAPAAG